MGNKTGTLLESRRKRLGLDGGSATNTGGSLLERRKERLASDGNAIRSDIYNRYKSALESHNTFVSENKSKWGDDAKEAYNSHRENALAVSQLKKDVEAYRGILGEDVDKIIEALDGMGSSYGSIYSRHQFKDEEDYNDAVKLNDLYSMSADEIAPYLNDKEKKTAYITSDGQEITWDSLYEAAKEKGYASHEDSGKGWEKYLSDDGEAKEKQPSTWMENIIRGFTTASDSPVGTAINNVAYDYRNDDSYKKPSDKWSDEEKNIFGYYYSQDPQKAYEYAERTNNRIAQTERLAEIEKIEDSATSGFWAGAGHTAASIFAGATGLADYVDNVIEYSQRGTITEKSSVTPFDYSQVATGAITSNLNEYGTLDEDIPIIGGKGWGDVYGAGKGIVESAVSAYALGGVGTAINYFGQGAASSVDDALARGADPGQALLFGTLAGIAEAATEYMGAEKLLGLGSSELKQSFIKTLLKQGGAEAIEEGTSSLLTTFADNLVMQDKSKINLAIQEYTNKGMGHSEATKKAWLDAAEEAAYSSAVGFVSGAVHAAPAYAVQKTKTNAKNKKIYAPTVDDAQVLVSEGLESPEGSESRKIAEKLKAKIDSGKSLSGADITRLVNANEQAIRSEDIDTMKTAAAERLQTLGESGDVSAIADVIAKQASGETLTRSEQDVLKNSKYGTRVSNEMSPENVGTGEYSNAWAENIGTNRINMGAYNYAENQALFNLAKETAGVSTPTAEETSVDGDELLKEAKGTSHVAKSAAKTVEVDGRVSEDGKTTRISTGEAVTIDKNNPIAKTVQVNGEEVVYYNTNLGEIEEPDIQYSNDSEAYIMKSFADMSPAIANAAIKAYDGSMPVQDYIAGMREGILIYGKHNFQAVGKDISADSSLAKLSAVDQALALDLGRKVAEIETTAADNSLKSAIRSAAEKVGKDSKGKPFKKGNVTFEKDVKATTDKQKATVAFAEKLAEVTGIRIVFYDSKVNPKHRYAKSDGASNSTTIWLDMSNSHQDAIAYTLSHEFVHFAKKWSKTEFKAFSDFMVEQFAEHGKNLEQLVAEKMGEIGTTDWDYAFEEVVCDACERMLLDSNAMEKLAQLQKKDPNVFEKFMQHIKDLLNKLRSLMADTKYTTEYSKELQEMEDVLSRFYELFENMAVDAVQNFQAAQVLETEAVSVSEDGTIQMQMKQYRETGRSTLLKYLREQYGEADANDLISTIDSIYNTMAEIKEDTALSVFGNWQETNVELDENGHPIFTTSINNGDYELNQDFSRVCKKRRQLNFVLNMLAKDPAFEASNLTTKDFVKINKAIKEHGFEIACALCFVDSKRFRQSEWADSFANTWNDILGSMKADKKALSRFNFATDSVNMADDGISIDPSKPITYRKWSKGKATETRTYKNLDDLLKNDGNTNVKRIATLIRDNPNLRHEFRGADIIASDGFDSIQRLAPDVRGILDGWGGTSVPKPSSNDAIYDNSILNLTGYNAKKAFAVGGVRMNSFSDFMAHMFFDYAQAFADLSAKKLPMHSYTKELDFARLFGLTGGKINMSAIAAIRSNAADIGKIKGKPNKEAATEFEKSVAGLDLSRLAEKLGKADADITYDDVIQNLDDVDYVWADESIDVQSATLLQSGILYDNLTEGKASYCYELIREGKFEEAFKVAGEENVNRGYAKHLGIITVGVSKAHILKLLRDPTIRMVIPYHKSGLNAEVAKEMKIAFYEDFTDVQNTLVKFKGGKSFGISSDSSKVNGSKIKDFAFYDYFGKTIDGAFYDGKKTAEKYREWCEKGAYDEKVGDYVYYLSGGGHILASDLHAKGIEILPKFYEFATEENYYKLIEDFDCYDTITGEHSSQEAVDMFHDGLPSDYKDVLVKALKAEQKVYDDFEDHLNNKGLKDEIMEIIKENQYAPSDPAAPWEQGINIPQIDLGTDLKFSKKKGFADSIGKITIGMPDSERSEILRKKNILAPFYRGQADALIEENKKSLESQQIGLVKAAITTIGKEFGLIGESIDIKDVGVVITLSKSNLKESVSKDVTPIQFAKLLPVLKESVENAVGIESHGNRYYFDTNTVYFENLLGGYIDGTDFVPVRFGLKHGISGGATLYVVVDQNKVETKLLDKKITTEVVKTTASHKVRASASRSVTYGISQIIPFVNSKDLLRYMPDDMLDANQKKAKWIAIGETIKKTANKNDKKYAEYISNGNLSAANRMVIAAAKSSGYTTIGYHGSRTPGFTVVDKYTWLWLARDESVANEYGVYSDVDDRGKPYNKKGVYAMRYNLGNNLEIYADGSSWGELPVTQDEYPGVYVNEETGDITTNAMAEWAERNGYDSITFVDVDDGGLTTVDVVFNPNQNAKSADTITYDDNGDIIPLSKRFDSSNDDIRYQKKKDSDYVQTGSKAVMTTERIDYLIEDSGAGSRVDYANYWITSISPTDFIDITTTPKIQDRAAFDKFPSEWNDDATMDTYDYMGELKRNMRQTPYLAINIETGEVVGHEGRHRMRALERSGVKSAEIRVEFRDEDGRTVKYSPDGKRLQVKDAVNIVNQFGTGQTASITNVIPLNKDYREEILANYGEDHANANDIRYQKKTVTNRTILSNALQSAIDTSTQAGQNELSTLKKYQSNIAKIEELESHLAEVNAEIKELSFSKGKRDTARLNALNKDKKETANRINTYDRRLLSLEATKPLKDILAREKELVRKRTEQKGKAALAALREKDAAVVRELMARNQESRKKNIENRNSTQMRHKIKGVVKTLNDYLTKGTKDKHVPIKLQKAVAEALDIVNMDTVGADERVAKYNALIAKAKDPDIIASLTETRDRIQEQGDKMGEKIAKFKSAYADIKNSQDPDMVNAYDESISNLIEKVENDVGDTPLRNMTLAQLEEVYDMYKAVLSTVRKANSLFKMERSESIATVANQVLAELDDIGNKKDYVIGGKLGSAIDTAKGFDWNNLKPVYAFERIGSKTLSKAYENVRKGEDTWAVDIEEAKAFKDAVAKKYHYDEWDFDKVYTFKNILGQEFKLTLEQMLSLYAYSKRSQADEHLSVGGFVFNDSIEIRKEKEDGKKSILKYRVNTAKAHKVDKATLAEIISTLSKDKDKIDFVDEMQDYLSTVMGAKGNEVSMALYDIKLYKEKNYFPLKSAQQYMYEQNQVAGEVRIKNSGFSKGTVPHARNPIILDNFLDVWANHVNDMSMYHAFVLPLEDFNRVFNYKTPLSDNADNESVKAFIQDVYGSKADDYISQLLKDLNGGARVDPKESISKKMIGTFKKASVFASASVVIQQPSAVARALALIDAKYFDFNPKLIQHKKLWSEVKKYAPVAIIKEMGHFDTDMGRSTVDYIKDEKTLMDKADNFMSKPAAYMDELTWCHIWTAVKREVMAKNKDLKGEDLLKKCGERFTEVVTKTQVYDSVLSRSANMRSKGVFMNMLTSFMAEPTTSINMLEDAITKWKRGSKGLATKQVGAVAASVILNSILVSLVYAARDDDEDETYAEKYLGSVVTELVEGFNPLTYYPIIKDVWSIMQGYDVERSDMSLISKAVDSLRGVMTVMEKDTSSTDEIVDAWVSLGGNFASIFGLPIKNIVRDVKAVFNVVNTANNGLTTSGSTLGAEVVESAKNAIPVWGWMSGDSKADKLYDAVVSGDQALIERAKAGYADEEKANSALKTAIGDHFKDGDIDADTAEEYLEEYLGMDEDDIYWQMERWQYTAETGSSDGYSKYDDFFTAVETGKNLKAVIQEYTNNGVDKKTLASQITSHYKPIYKEMSNYERASLKGYLLNAYSILGYDRSKKSKDIDKWLKED